MNKKYILGIIIGLGLAVAGTAHAVSIFSVPQGGTGAGTLTGILKGNGTSAFTAAVNGTDYSLISALACSAGQHLFTVAANGSFTCSADSGGGGSGGGSWSTTTSQVSGRLINYPNNTTDIVNIGSTATTTGKYWFDPNTLTSFLSGKVGIGTTSPYLPLSVVGNGGVVAETYTATSTTATSTLVNLRVTGTLDAQNLILGPLQLSGTNNTLVALNSTGTLISTTTAYVNNINATSTSNSTGTSTFSGSIHVGTLYNGQFAPSGFNSSSGYHEIDIGDSINDGLSLLTLGNRSSGSLSAGCITLVNDKTSFEGGINATYGANICMAGSQFAALPGLPANAFALDVTDAPMVIAAVSNNYASSTICFASGAGYVTANYDLCLGNLNPTAYPVNSGYANLGLGSSTPSARLVITAPATTTIPYFLVASSTNGSNSTVGSIPQQTLFQITKDGIASTTNLNISSITGTTCLQAINGVVSGTGSACGSGGGGGGSAGTFSTTTSTVAGQLVNYSNNNTDILSIGANSTTTSKFYVDPNAQFMNLVGNASTTALNVSSPTATTTLQGLVSVGMSLTGGAIANSQLMVKNTSNRAGIVNFLANDGTSAFSITDSTKNAVFGGTGNFGTVLVGTSAVIGINITTLTIGNNGQAGAGSGTLYEGSAATNGAMTLRSTTGVGTADFIRAQVGNNGGTEGWRLISNGNFGVGTSTPFASFQAAATSTNATTTIELGVKGQNKGTCIKLYDEVGTGYYLKVSGGALNLSTTNCASIAGF